MITTLFGSTVLILLDRETERVGSSPAAAQLVGEGEGARAGPGRQPEPGTGELPHPLSVGAGEEVCP